METMPLSKVDNQRLVDTFDEIYDECFSFAFVLTREELKAQQIVLDAIELCLVTERSFLISISEDHINPRNKRIVILKVLKNIFSLVKQDRARGGLSLRETDLSRELQVLGRLDLVERATLYLRHKTAYEWEDLELIINMDKVGLITVLNAGRSKFASDYGIADYD